MKKLAILIPCHNEEKGISKVIDSIPHKILKQLHVSVDVIVIDNNSTDKTVSAALSKNATVISEMRKGKGYAMLTGFNNVMDDTDYVVMLDGDGTYLPNEIIRIIEPLMSDFCDVVVGSRLGGKIKKNSLKFQNRVVNWGYTFLVRQFYGANVTDVLSGYFAWKKIVIDKLAPHLESEGFEIEMEMITKMTKLGFTIYSVPITYDEREGESKIEAIRDGTKILQVFVKNLLWSPKKGQNMNVRFQQRYSQ